MITADDYLFFADEALTGMAEIVSELGDDGANARAYDGANTPYALLFHCLAVVETWVGGFVRGRPIDRDREHEFSAEGPVAPLCDRVEQVREQLRLDVRAATPEAPLTQEPPASYQGPDRELTQGATLQHVYEELAQHRGQMETLRDLLVIQRAEATS